MTVHKSANTRQYDNHLDDNNSRTAWTPKLQNYFEQVMNGKLLYESTEGIEDEQMPPFTDTVPFD